MVDNKSNLSKMQAQKKKVRKVTLTSDRNLIVKMSQKRASDNEYDDLKSNNDMKLIQKLAKMKEDQSITTLSSGYLNPKSKNDKSELMIDQQVTIESIQIIKKTLN